jgi:hypothetical protein
MAGFVKESRFHFDVTVQYGFKDLSVIKDTSTPVERAIIKGHKQGG